MSDNKKRCEEIEKKIAQFVRAGKNMNDLQNEGGEGYDFTNWEAIENLENERFDLEVTDVG